MSTGPAVGEPDERLASPAQVTGSCKAAPPAASAALLGPVFRLLAGQLDLLARPGQFPKSQLSPEA